MRARIIYKYIEDSPQQGYGATVCMKYRNLSPNVIICKRFAVLFNLKWAVDNAGITSYHA